MGIPFNVGQFLEVFARYNQAVWPAQIGFYVVAVLLVALAVRPSRRSSRWISGLLALLWAWMGIVYHWGFFAPINQAAYAFGGFFVLQALAFVTAGVFHERLSFRYPAGAYGIIGTALITYALILYPILGAAVGHPYPRGATLGLPCPTTILTFGLLLWASRAVPLWTIAIPAVWSLVGAAAALQLTITEDYGLLVAGALGTALVIVKNRRLRRASMPPMTLSVRA